MTELLFHRGVVPVTTRDDAAATTALLGDVGSTDRTVTAVHVVGKVGDTPDGASVEQRERRATDIARTVTGGVDEIGVCLDTELRCDPGIERSVIGATHDSNATATGCTPREGRLWRKLLTGDVTGSPSDVPVLLAREVSGA